MNRLTDKILIRFRLHTVLGHAISCARLSQCIRSISQQRSARISWMCSRHLFGAYVAICGAFITITPTLAQSSATLTWEKAAGGRTSFEVASVKQNRSGDPPFGAPPHSNVNLTAFDTYAPNGGLFSATNWPLLVYIQFAYKLTPSQLRPPPQLPKWATTERFDIEARAPKSNPSKDQMRLMMQSLLSDRFKLLLHFEPRRVPVYALVLVKNGKLGPQLLAYADGPPCSSGAPPQTQSLASQPSGVRFDGPCGGMTAGLVSGQTRVSERNATMEEIASDLIVLGKLDRPVLNETGLKGPYDFVIEWRREMNGFLSPDDQSAAMGPTFLEALREQLGLKLEARNGRIEVPVIDHVEPPSEN